MLAFKESYLFSEVLSSNSVLIFSRIEIEKRAVGPGIVLSRATKFFTRLCQLSSMNSSSIFVQLPSLVLNFFEYLEFGKLSFFRSSQLELSSYLFENRNHSSIKFPITEVATQPLFLGKQHSNFYRSEYAYDSVKKDKLCLDARHRRIGFYFSLSRLTA